MGYGWDGSKVRLVPLDVDRHLANAQRWINDPTVTEWVLIGDFPVSLADEREWLKESHGDPPRRVRFAIETLDGQHIGFSGLESIDWRNRFAATGTLIGECNCWGHGYGTDASRVRARYAFEVLGLRMLLSGYLEGNEGSRKMNERVGYVECGRVPNQIWKRGAYRDLVNTVLTRERFLESRTDPL